MGHLWDRIKVGRLVEREGDKAGGLLPAALRIFAQIRYYAAMTWSARDELR